MINWKMRPKRHVHDESMMCSEMHQKQGRPSGKSSEARVQGMTTVIGILDLFFRFVFFEQFKGMQ